MSTGTFIAQFALALLLVVQTKAQSSLCLCNNRGSTCDITVHTCAPGNICPCASFSKDNCPGDGVPIDCVTSGGTGDPMFTAFDGSRFYFHGLHAHRYLIHAVNHGESLVAKMRATNELWLCINRTYFEQFGLYLPVSKTKLRFFLRKDAENSRWEVGTELNGTPVPYDGSSALPSAVQVVERRGKVVVDTPFTQYTIKGVSLNSVYRRHLDFSVRIKKLHNDHQFGGILGRTVSIRTRNLVRKQDSDDKKKQFDMKMRELYTVTTLFPSANSLLHGEKFVSPDIHIA